MQYPAHMQPTHARWELVKNQENTEDIDEAGRLPHLDPVYGRSFRIHDLCLESAPESWFATVGSDREVTGLSSVPSSTLEELPAECLLAFEAAKAREAEWQGKWNTEQQDGLRARPLPSFEWFPK